MMERMYRGKRTDNGEWVEGAYYKQTKFYGDPWESHYIITSKDVLEDNMMIFYEVSPETVGQYTGRTDKNTNKIFDGDVLSHFINYLGRRINGVVEYDTEMATYMWKPKGLSSLFLADVLSGNSAEIIGNIHDNPELMEEVRG